MERLRALSLWVTALLALLALALLLAGCEDGKPGGAPLPLSIAVVAQPVAALVHVADEKGFFREEGVEVALSAFDLGRDALASALAGGADLATVYDLPVARQLNAGEDLAILATLHRSVSGHAVLARRERGIARPEDLRGKRIGVTKGISTDYFLALFLTSHGLPQAAVKEVPLEPADYAQALAGGAIDALVTFNPHTYKLREGWSAFRAEARLDNLLLTQLIQQVHWLRENNQRERALPDFARALAAEYLAAVRPRAVTVLHGGR